MNQRIENLRGAGRLVDEPAPDSEVVGIWMNAVEAYEDACLTNRPLNRRLTSAYDAARTAALAIVRTANFRVRANNHHEVTLATAGFLVEEAQGSFHRAQEMRAGRIQIEYGWSKHATANEVDDAVGLAQAILHAAGAWIRRRREAVAAEIVTPR